MGFVRGITGVDDQKDAARAAASTQAASGREAIKAQRQAAQRAQSFFEPFEGTAQRGIEASSFLANPEEQFDFLQSNPLFKLALENANQSTLQQASANKRLSFGDTLQSLSNNVLLSASPLIDRQRADVAGLLDFGTNVAGSRANIETGLGTNVSNLTTGIGNSISAGQIAAGNAKAQGFSNLINTAGAIGGIAAGFSDVRLKTNKQFVTNDAGHNWYTWDWNELAGELLGLFGDSFGVMAQEAILINPDAVVMDDSGFYKVNYGAL